MLWYKSYFVSLCCELSVWRCSFSVWRCSDAGLFSSCIWERAKGKDSLLIRVLYLCGWRGCIGTLCQALSDSFAFSSLLLWIFMSDRSPHTSFCVAVTMWRAYTITETMWSETERYCHNPEFWLLRTSQAGIKLGGVESSTKSRPACWFGKSIACSC